MSQKKTKIKGPVTFLTAFKANAIDMLIILAISVTILLVGDLLLRVLLGMFVADMISMLLILIIIVSVVYNTVMQSSRKTSTFGQRIAEIYIKNKEE